jgi:hypothetical protein
MSEYPYKEIGTSPGGAGKMQPPKGRDCAWLVHTYFGSKASRPIKKCLNDEIVIIRETTVSQATPTADGDCKIAITNVITTIHTGKVCDSATFQEEMGGDVDEEYDKAIAIIDLREAREREKETKQAPKKSK